jgi:hypothetical protein
VALSRLWDYWISTFTREKNDVRQDNCCDNV